MNKRRFFLRSLHILTMSILVIGFMLGGMNMPLRALTNFGDIASLTPLNSEEKKVSMPLREGINAPDSEEETTKIADDTKASFFKKGAQQVKKDFLAISREAHDLWKKGSEKVSGATNTLTKYFVTLFGLEGGGER